MDKKTIGAKIRQARRARGFSQEKLSEIVDISPRQMCLIENGNSYPSLGTFVNIAKILEIDINQFFNISFKNIEDERIEIIDMIKSTDRKNLPLISDIIRAVVKYR